MEAHAAALIPSAIQAQNEQNENMARVIFPRHDLQRPPIESAGQMVYLVPPSSSGSALSFPAGHVQGGEHTSACSGVVSGWGVWWGRIPQQPTTGCSSLKRQLFRFKVLLEMQTLFPRGFLLFFWSAPITTGEELRFSAHVSNFWADVTSDSAEADVNVNWHSSCE